MTLHEQHKGGPRGGRAAVPDVKTGWYRPPSVWTAWDGVWVKTGGACVLMGVLAHVLPTFGLQFRKLANLGSAAGTGGTLLVCAGVFLLAYVVLLKGRMVRLVLGAAAVVVLGVVGLFVAAGVATRWGTSAPNRPAMPTGPGAPPLPPGVGPGPGMAGGMPGGPAGVPGGGPGSRPPGGPPAMPKPPDEAALVSQFGHQRVARYALSNVSGVDVAATIRARLAEWPAQERPASWRVSFSGDTGTLLMAPVEDLRAMAERLNLGTWDGEDGEDAGARRGRITVDKARCVKAGAGGAADRRPGTTPGGPGTGAEAEPAGAGGR